MYTYGVPTCVYSLQLKLPFGSKIFLVSLYRSTLQCFQTKSGKTFSYTNNIQLMKGREGEEERKTEKMGQKFSSQFKPKMNQSAQIHTFCMGSFPNTHFLCGILFLISKTMIQQSIPVHHTTSTLS